ncbi:MAG: type II secretion system protein [Clostridia bacterium]
MQEIVKNNKVNEEKDIVKKQTGITLIALVITIIVLLILAGVSIATLTGNNGILTQANQAKENNNSAAVKEKVEVEALGSMDKSGKFNESTFEENVTKILKEVL